MTPWGAQSEAHAGTKGAFNLLELAGQTGIFKNRILLLVGLVLSIQSINKKIYTIVVDLCGNLVENAHFTCKITGPAGQS